MVVRDWQNLARETRQRRDDLGLTQEEAAAEGGPSTATQRLIENAAAKTYRQRTFRDLEKALRLRPGSVRAALRGGQFTPLEEDEPAPPGPPRDPAIEHIRRTPSLSPDVIRALENMARIMRDTDKGA